MTITPGYTFTPSEAVTAAKLNLLGTPTVALAQADLDAAVAEAETQLGDGVVKMNLADNPGFDQWTRGSSAVNCAVGVRQLRADRWWCRLASTTSDLVTYQRTAINAQNFIYGAKITGAAVAGIVDFGQDIAARLAATLFDQCTLTFTIANGTSVAITPLVRLDTCDTREDFDTVTNRASVAASSSVTAGNEKTFSVTLDLAAAAASLRNGCLLYIRIPAGTLVDAAKTVTISALKLERGAVATANWPERDLNDPDTATNVDRNWLDNAELVYTRWLTSSTTATHGVNTYAAEGWYVNPVSGDTLTYAREQAGPANNKTGYCAKLTGATAVTNTVDFGQELPSRIARQLQSELVFSAWIYNGTGASFTPLYRADTAGAEDDWTSAVNRDSQSLGACANGQWTQVSFALNGADYTNIVNGARIYLRFPVGSLDSGAKFVRIAQAKLEYGTTATEFVPTPIWEPGIRTFGASPDLSIAGASATTIGVKCDQAVLREDSGRLMTVFGVNVTINAANTGVNGIDTGAVAADTAYYVWLVGMRNSAVGAILSLNATAPAMPSGYTFKTLIGWTRYTSSDFRLTFQRGRTVRYAARALFTNIATGQIGTSYTSIQTAAALSAGYLAGFGWDGRIAKLYGDVYKNTTTARVLTLAANSSGAGETIVNCGDGTQAPAGIYGNTPFTCPMVPATQQDFQAKVDNTATITWSLRLTGFDF